MVERRQESGSEERMMLLKRRMEREMEREMPVGAQREGWRWDDGGRDRETTAENVRERKRGDTREGQFEMERDERGMMTEGWSMVG